MACLYAIGFVAGIVTAISPCVLPVLPIIFAGGGERRTAAPVRDHRGARHDVRRLAALRRLAARPARALEDVLRKVSDRLPAAPRSDAGRIPPLARADRATVTSARATSLGRPRRRLPARREPRARLRPLRRAGARVHHDADREPREGGKRAGLVAVAYAVGAAVPMLLIALGGRALRGAFVPALRLQSQVRAGLGGVMAVCRRC